MKELVLQVLAGDSDVNGHFRKDGGEGAHAQGAVPGDRDVVLPFALGGEPNVGSSLAGHLVTEGLESPGQILSREVAGKLRHAGIT